MACFSTSKADLNRLRELTPGERRLFFRAALCLPLIHAGLLLLGYTRTCGLMQMLLPLKPVEVALPGSQVLQQARETARIVSIAAQHGLYKATCLRRSLLVWGLLRRQGVQSKICFGVRMSDCKLEAHAWLEYKGLVLNDSLMVNHRYTPLREAFPPTNSGL